MTQHGTTVQVLLAPISLERLTKDAGWIVRGTVQQVLPGAIAYDLLTKRRLVYTDTLILVKDQYKGELPVPTIIVRSLGGQTPELSMSVPTAPSFAPHEEVILLLSKDAGQHFLLEDNAFVVHGWASGKFSIEGEQAFSAIERKPIPLENLVRIIKS